VINIELDGMMLSGAFCGVWAALVFGSLTAGFVGAALGGTLVALGSPQATGQRALFPHGPVRQARGRLELAVIAVGVHPAQRAAVNRVFRAGRCCRMMALQRESDTRTP
jgi:hypothetical protein